jgi:hypothetical protein
VSLFINRDFEMPIAPRQMPPVAQAPVAGQAPGAQPAADPNKTIFSLKGAGAIAASAGAGASVGKNFGWQGAVVGAVGGAVSGAISTAVFGANQTTMNAAGIAAVGLVGPGTSAKIAQNLSPGVKAEAVAKGLMTVKPLQKALLGTVFSGGVVLASNLLPGGSAQAKSDGAGENKDKPTSDASNAAAAIESAPEGLKEAVTAYEEAKENVVKPEFFTATKAGRQKFDDFYSGETGAQVAAYLNEQAKGDYATVQTAKKLIIDAAIENKADINKEEDLKVLIDSATQYIADNGLQAALLKTVNTQGRDFAGLTDKDNTKGNELLNSLGSSGEVAIQENGFAALEAGVLTTQLARYNPALEKAKVDEAYFTALQGDTVPVQTALAYYSGTDDPYAVNKTFRDSANFMKENLGIEVTLETPLNKDQLTTIGLPIAPPQDAASAPPAGGEEQPTDQSADEVQPQDSAATNPDQAAIDPVLAQAQATLDADFSDGGTATQASVIAYLKTIYPGASDDEILSVLEQNSLGESITPKQLNDFMNQESQ